VGFHHILREGLSLRPSLRSESAMSMIFSLRSQLLYARGNATVSMSRTIEKIKGRIKKGKAAVLTQQEISEIFNEKRKDRPVSTAFRFPWALS